MVETLTFRASQGVKAETPIMVAFDLRNIDPWADYLSFRQDRRRGQDMAMLIAYGKSIAKHQDGPNIDSAVKRIVTEGQSKGVSERVTGKHIAQVIARAQERNNSAQLQQAIRSIARPSVIGG